ncbi:MAG TPA: ABC transporter permease [Myxococcales bacterium]|nr:ABC transporter permease [Myxococcales bacterium]
MLQDLRLAFRSLRRAPTYSFFAIAALAIAIGANTSLFSLIEATLLRPSQYPHVERLLILRETMKDFTAASVALPNLDDWREQTKTHFSGVAGYRRDSFTLTGSGEPERLSGRMVTSDFFDVVGIQPQLGRAFVEENDKAGAARTVILGNALWQRRFASDPRVIGQSITLAGDSYTVIGVMPQGFRFFSPQDLFVPLHLWADKFKNRQSHPGISAIARLRPGVAQKQAAEALDTVAVRLEKEYPASNTGNRVNVRTMRQVQTEDYRTALFVLWGAVGLVLLIAAANVANLSLARAAARAPELAIRSALGAGRGRLVRELLTESVLLALGGGALGVLLAFWGLDALLPLVPEDLRRNADVTINGAVLAFTLVLSVITGLAFGVLPALRASRPDLDTLLRDVHSTDSRPRRRLRSALVVAEIALSLSLLIGAGLLLRSFSKLADVDLGFQPHGVVAFNLLLPDGHYPDGAAELRFEGELRRRLSALPGVRAVSVTPGSAPLLDDNSANGYWIDGREKPLPGKDWTAYQYNASPGFLAAMGGRLLRGRDLRETDDGKHPVALVDDGFVRQQFANGEDPLGHFIDFDVSSLGLGIVKLEIVGVYSHMSQLGPGDEDRVDAGMILPISWGATYAPQWFHGLGVVVRSDGDPAALITAARREVLALDPLLPIFEAKTLDIALGDVLAGRRFALVLLGLFAAVALILAAVGVYGVMSYGVVQRTREIGIRMALGARQQDVLRLVVSDGARMAGLGVCIGLLLAAGLSRVLRGMLFGISAFDPLSYGVLTLVLVVIALAASWLPAHRASKVDPHEALRAD